MYGEARCKKLAPLKFLNFWSARIGVAYGAVLIYRLTQQWRWLTDPPEWTSLIYFPTVIKMIVGSQTCS